ncbi:protein LURP-one-related 12-like isoform X1 [Coffea eugenioides]|uniref:protein LURP-one-related 12-like isoform X1 n=1 Tax=Coffea eugenioides TaxID=49369 RepID=UPI000F615518|nr:protein LURP-one-related 12-like isoform X1 [Coffea eugenioides]
MSSRSLIVDKIFCFEEETHLTVHRTSIFVPGGGDGFIVYNPTGEITFRVDSYGPDSASKDELVLMDGFLRQISRHPPPQGEKKKDEQQAAFSIFKSYIIGKFDLLVEVCGHDPVLEYHIFSAAIMCHLQSESR